MNLFLAISFLCIYQKSNVDTSPDVCVYIDHHDKRVNVTKIGCPDNDICKKTFNISHVNMLPYNYYKPLRWLLKRCCGSCAKYRHVNIFANISEVSPSSINSSDFVFPFFATKSTVMLYGKYFIPYWDAPYAVYITTEEANINMLNTIVFLYPLIIIALLLGVISGFVVWIMDTWYNKEEFPRPFFIGWFEGFWWSFVSMTTVGYGDKTPKSIHARLFSVVWILVGIITFGLLTASLTTEILNINSPPPPDMSGAMVGALRYRDYDALIIAKHNGLVKRTNRHTKVFHNSIFELIIMLQKKEIEGFLLDKYTLQFVTLVMLKNLNKTIQNKYRNEIDFFMHHTTKTIKRYNGNYKLSYGILVKGYENYKYFGSVIEGNQLHHEMARSLRGNIRKQNITKVDSLFYATRHGLFSPSGHYFPTTINVGFGIVGAICIFGILYEIRRKRIACKLYKSQNDKSQNENMIL